MKIHPTAIVEDGAELGADVEVGPYAHIGRFVKIGDGTTQLTRNGLSVPMSLW